MFFIILYVCAFTVFQCISGVKFTKKKLTNFLRKNKYAEWKETHLLSGISAKSRRKKIAKSVEKVPKLK